MTELAALGTEEPMVIVGAGQSGLQVAESLRAGGYEGRVVMLGEEPHPPYHRPPLSKAYLAGEAEAAQLTIRGPDALARKRIELRTGVAVAAIDRDARELALSDGSRLRYAGLALTTGARVRRLPLPGADCGNVFGLRTLDDVHAIAQRLVDARDVVVIGGGFIGLEFAAVAAKQGKRVTVLEAAERLMARVVAPPVSAFYVDLHRRHGVVVELGCVVSEIVAGDAPGSGREGGIRHGGPDGDGGPDGRFATGVRTADGREHPADLVVYGIGVVPNDQLAVAAGLACDHGVIVDDCGRTADPRVVASGDCTARRLADGRLLRLESVQNAVEQGKSAAAALLGKERPFVASPWFWSDQYVAKLQMVGLSAGYDEVITRGDPDEGRFSVFYYAAGRLLAIDSINQPQDHMTGRKLLDRGVSPTPAQAADSQFVLPSLLK